MGRKKATAQTPSDQNSTLTSPQEFEVELNPKKNLSFKNKLQDPSKGVCSTKKSKVLKNYKQIILNERSLQWSEKDADYTYSSVDALPSFKPQKKYSDISGIPALYTDPHSKLRYANVEEFLRIKNLPSDIVSGLLNLRKANGCSS